MRTIQINIDGDLNNYPPAVYDAIKYLTCWAYGAYDTVNIYPDSLNTDKDMFAVFTESGDSAKKYVIGAVYDERKEDYSFHS